MSNMEFYRQKIKARKEWPIFCYLVLDRADFICEICREKKATQVHHLTYERWGNELDEDIIAVCVDCHTGEHVND